MLRDTLCKTQCSKDPLITLLEQFPRLQPCSELKNRIYHSQGQQEKTQLDTPYCKGSDTEKPEVCSRVVKEYKSVCTCLKCPQPTHNKSANASKLFCLGSPKLVMDPGSSQIPEGACVHSKCLERQPDIHNEISKESAAPIKSFLCICRWTELRVISPWMRRRGPQTRVRIHATKRANT